MSCCDGCCKGTCSCCCCGDGKNPKVEYEHLVDGNIFNNRSCTDCLMIPLYVIMVAGWVVLLIVASQLGHPERILYASNFRGTTCGNSDIPAVADRPNYWVPIPTLPTYGYCTDACPSVGDVACNNDVEPMIGNANVSVPNTYYNHKSSEFIAGAKMTAQCAVSSCTAAEQEVADRFVGLQFRMKESKCFMAMYSSQPAVYRCVPFEVDVNMTLMEAVNASASQLTDLTDTLGVTGFFQLGFGEVMQCWRVILICMFTACAVAAVWVLLLRWILAPMVYICLILVLGVLLGIGFVARKLSQDITALNLPGDSGTGNHGQLYTVVMWVAFVGAGVYFVVALWLLNRIRIAIAVMKEASKAFLSAPSLIFVPPIIFVLLIGWLAFFVVTTIYIQTMGDLSTDTVGAIVGDLVGETVVNVSAYVASSANAALQEYTGENASMLLANATSFNATAGIKGLHAYNFFMVLWTSNMFIMLGFFAMSMTIVSWYFSTAEGLARSAEAAVEDGTAVAATSELPKPKDKYVVVGAVCRSLCAVIRNHLGTVLWGALLIAIIQFIRAVFIYLQETVLKDMKETTSGKVVLCIVNCCLWYIEKIVRVISKNAFIITSIKNVSFCSAAVEAVGLLLTNGLRFSVLLSLSTATLFVIKVFIVGCNALIAYGLMQQKSLTDDRAVESGLFPYFGIVLATFAIASLFLNVYEACIDTIFLCFLVDETDYQGLFMPESLAELVGLFAGAEEARKQYEAAVAAASRKSADIKAPRPSS